MNIREIKDLIQLMNEHKLAEIEMEYEGTKIKLRKSEHGVVAETPEGRFVEQGEPRMPLEAVPPEKAGRVIESPMVGTFYAAPSPDAEPYVKVGSKVEVGQVVCIIEAMKLMNEIKSEFKGTLAAVHVANGSPVEFAQPLFTVV